MDETWREWMFYRNVKTCPRVLLQAAQSDPCFFLVRFTSLDIWAAQITSDKLSTKFLVRASQCLRTFTILEATSASSSYKWRCGAAIGATNWPNLTVSHCHPGHRLALEHMEQGLGRLQDLHVGSLKDIPIAFCAEILAQTNPFIHLKLTLCDSWSSICVVCGENYVLGCVWVYVCICMYVIVCDLTWPTKPTRNSAPFCWAFLHLFTVPQAPKCPCSLGLLDRLVILVAGLGLAHQTLVHLRRLLETQKIALPGPWIRKTPRSNSQITIVQLTFGVLLWVNIQLLPRRTFCKRSVKMESSFWIFALSSSSCRTATLMNSHAPLGSSVSEWFQLILECTSTHFSANANGPSGFGDSAPLASHAGLQLTSPARCCSSYKCGAAAQLQRAYWAYRLSTAPRSSNWSMARDGKIVRSPEAPSSHQCSHGHWLTICMGNRRLMHIILYNMIA